MILLTNATDLARTGRLSKMGKSEDLPLKMYTKPLSEEKLIVMKRCIPLVQRSNFALFCISLLCLVACNGPDSKKRANRNSQTDLFPQKVSIDHAIGFDVIYHNDWKELHLFRHYNDFIDTVKYALLTAGMTVNGFDESHSIQIPVQAFGALSTTQLGMFDLLDALNELKAIEVKRYVHNQEIIDKVEKGDIIELAPAGKLNLETTIASNIELLMGVGYPNSQNDDFQTLQQMGMPVILNADWQEKTLLGRAEWMKILAILTNKEAEVKEVWSKIESDYQAVVDKIQIEIEEGPSTITGLISGDSWYVAGGDSFVNNLLKEIKVSYPWSDANETGSIRLDFETVYEKGLDADYWLAPGSAKTMDDLLQADGRFVDFKSFKEQKVFNIFGRYIPAGGNDYYESAIVAPHIVLKDMVKIFYPELFPDHELVYYNQLQ